MVEVFVQMKSRQRKKIQFRATHARFDEEGKADLHHAAEVMAIILDGIGPKKLDETVLEISPTLRARKRERETQWRLPHSVKRAILADLKREAKLPLLRLRA